LVEARIWRGWKRRYFEERALHVQHIIATRILSTGPSEGQELVKERFDATDILHRVLVEEDTLDGVVSERNALRGRSP